MELPRFALVRFQWFFTLCKWCHALRAHIKNDCVIFFFMSLLDPFAWALTHAKCSRYRKIEKKNHLSKRVSSERFGNESKTKAIVVNFHNVWRMGAADAHLHRNADENSSWSPVSMFFSPHFFYFLFPLHVDFVVSLSIVSDFFHETTSSLVFLDLIIGFLPLLWRTLRIFALTLSHLPDYQQIIIWVAINFDHQFRIGVEKMCQFI